MHPKCFLYMLSGIKRSILFAYFCNIILVIPLMILLICSWTARQSQYTQNLCFGFANFRKNTISFVNYSRTNWKENMLGADETFFKSEAGSSDCFNFIVVLIKSFRKIGFNSVFCTFRKSCSHLGFLVLIINFIWVYIIHKYTIYCFGRNSPKLPWQLS